MMKIAIRLLGLLILALVIFAAAFVYNPALYVGLYLKHMFKSYGITASFEEIKVEKYKTVVRNLSLYNGFNVLLGRIDAIEARYDISKAISNIRFDMEADIQNARVVYNGENVISTDLELIYSAEIFTKNKEIKLLNTKNNQPKLECHFKQSAKLEMSGQCDTQVGYTTFTLELDRIKSLLDGALKVRNLNLKSYRAFRNIFPKNHRLISFLDEFIEDGIVENGVLNFKIDLENLNDITSDDVNGNFKIVDLNLRYHKDFPVLTGINTDLTISGSKFFFLINSGKSGSSVFNNSKVELEVKEVKNTEVVVNAEVVGPAKDLVDFIPSSSLKKLKLKDIDLRSIQGTAYTNLNIIIPLEEAEPNRYNIRSSIKNVSLSCLGESIKLKARELHGIFDGNSVVVFGDSTINDNYSYLTFTHNLNKDAEIEDLMDIDLTISKFSLFNNIKVDNGVCYTKVKYRSAPKKIPKLTIYSDLSKSNFNVKVLGVEKSALERGNLLIESFFDQEYPDFLVQLKTDSMSVSGKVNLNKDYKSADLKIIKGNDSKLIKIKKDSERLFCEMNSGLIDLSDEDISKLFTKTKNQSQNYNFDIKANVEKIILKNEIILDDINFRLKCGEQKCAIGSLEANVGTKKITASLLENNVWNIKTENAGAILAGLGLYDKIKAGTLDMKFDSFANKAEFTLERFVLIDASFKAKIISIASFPGLIKGLTSNSMPFVKMVGGIKIDNNIVKLENLAADGQHFDFTMNGVIDLDNNYFELKGAVTPSLYGVSTLIKKMPLFGQAFSERSKKGLVFAPYTIKGKLKD